MAHVGKYTKVSCGHLLKHYERAQDENGAYIKFGNTNIDLNKTELNYNLAPKRDLSQQEFLNKRLSEVKCFNRKDVKVMCTWVVTKPKDLELGLEEEFFKKTYDFLEEKYGEKNVISAYVHNDEVTPHIHFSFIPVIKDKKKGIDKVSAKEVLTRIELKTFHQDLNNYLEKELGREINILNEATKEGNKSIDELKRGSAIEEIKKLKAEKNKLIEDYFDKEKEIEELKEQEQAYIERINKFSELNNTLIPVEEKKSLFNADIKVVMDKKVYDSCVSAYQKEQSLSYQLENITNDFEKYKESTRVIKLLERNMEIENLKKENKKLKNEKEELKKANDKMNEFIDKNNLKMQFTLFNWKDKKEKERELKIQKKMYKMNIGFER